MYGYIPIEIEYIQNIIDTPMFQRLRRVMQTSYSPLYSSSFSHTGEIYYIYYKNGKEEEVSVKRLHEKLCRLLNSESFKADLPIESDSAAPHELMSAIVGIREFRGLTGDLECQEFFVRCITGYVYKKIGHLEDIKNCFIGMLNSKVIDVDRLDYLIRDAYTSGFVTINIDYV